MNDKEDEEKAVAASAATVDDTDNGTQQQGTGGEEFVDSSDGSNNNHNNDDSTLQSNTSRSSNHSTSTLERNMLRRTSYSSDAADSTTMLEEGTLGKIAPSSNNDGLTSRFAASTSSRSLEKKMLSRVTSEGGDSTAMLEDNKLAPPELKEGTSSSSFKIPDAFLSDQYLRLSKLDTKQLREQEEDEDSESSHPMHEDQTERTANVQADFGLDTEHLAAAQKAAAQAEALSKELEDAQSAAAKAEEQAAKQRQEILRVRVAAEKAAAEKARLEEVQRDERLREQARQAEAALQALRDEERARAAQKQEQLQEALRAQELKAAEEARRAQEEQDRALKELQEAALAAQKQLEQEELQLDLEARGMADLQDSQHSGRHKRDNELQNSFLSTLAVPLLQELHDMCTIKEEEVFCTFYEADAKATKSLTYGKIWDQSGLVSYHLRHTWGVQKGEHVVLCLDYGVSYISAWVGCLRAGVVPIVVASPLPPFDLALTKMNLVLKAAAPIALVLTDSVIDYWKEEDRNNRESSSRFMWPLDAPWQVVDKLPRPQEKGSIRQSVESLRSSMFRRSTTPRSSIKHPKRTTRSQSPSTNRGTRSQSPSAKSERAGSFLWNPSPTSASAHGSSEGEAADRKSFLWASAATIDINSNEYDEANLKPDDVACFTHTSGSTGDPKVVSITYEALYEAFQMTQRDLSFIFMTGGSSNGSLEGFSWLPPDNHTGLFMAMLCPLMSGVRMHYMSNLTLDQVPLHWLELMSRYKIGWTIAPDPAYRWLMKSFEMSTMDTSKSSKYDPSDLDLSSLQHLLNIGEATRFDTQSKFKKVFGPYGLHKECSVTAGYGLAEHLVAASWVPGEFVVVPSTLNFAPTNWVAVARRSGLPKNVSIVVVDASSRQVVPNGTVGEIWINTPCVVKMGQGYHKDKKLSKKIFHGRLKGSKHVFLRTGDLGFWEIDHLYICGRNKDALENKEGVKYYPPDVEWVVEDASPQVKPGCVACFPSVGGTVEIVFEIMNASSPEVVRGVCQAVTKAIQDTTGIEPSSVVAVPDQAIPKTSTGLVERRITKSKLLKEEMTVLYDYPQRSDRTRTSISLTPETNKLVLERASVEDVKKLIQKTKRASTIGERGLSNLHNAELDNIISRYVGSNIDGELSWEELGMTSTKSVPMRRDLEASMFVTLPPNYLDQYPNPAALKEKVGESSGSPIMTDKLYLSLNQSRHLSWGCVGFCQAFLSLIIIILFCVPVLPCYCAFPFLLTMEPALMLLVPIWMTTFSFVVILAKWLVVGRYKEIRLVTPSYPFLQWWFVDRLVDLWEVWVGQFILNTPFLWWFYFYMGAKIQPTCQLDGFIREFDLVTLGDYVSMQYFCLKCRKFSSWESFEQGPMMAFRPISIGSRSKIRGMVSLGAKLGEGVLVDKLAVVPEGADVEDQVKLAGNPAFVADEIDDPEFGVYRCWFPVGMFKCLWILVELGIMYGIWKGAEYINQRPGDVDVGTPDYWMIFGATCILLSLLSSIVVKLLLIGVKRPGKLSCCCYHPFDWAADYHFRLVTLPFLIFFQNSRLCNFVLMLHGMDIDFASKVDMECFPPSKMDLVKVRRSYISSITLDVKSDGAFHKTIIVSSSIGKFAHLAAEVKVIGAVIPPLIHVTEDVLRDREKIKPKHRMGHTCIMYIRETSKLVFDVVVLGGVLATLVPPVMVFTATKDLDMINEATIIPITAVALIYQSVSWFLVFAAVQFMAFLGVYRKRTRPCFPCLHYVYLNCSNTYQTWSFMRVVWGSPLYTILVRFLGATVEGEMAFLGERMDDYYLQTVAERTVLDGATVFAHNIVYERNHFRRTRVSGLIRERTLILADANITRKESGPWRAEVKSSVVAQRKPSTKTPTSFSQFETSGGSLQANFASVTDFEYQGGRGFSSRVHAQGITRYDSGRV